MGSGLEGWGLGGRGWDDDDYILLTLEGIVDGFIFGELGGRAGGVVRVGEGEGGGMGYGTWDGMEDGEMNMNLNMWESQSAMMTVRDWGGRSVCIGGGGRV